MRFLFLMVLFSPGLALAQSSPAGPGTLPQNFGRALFDQPVASTGVTFATGVETQIPSCSYTVPAGTLANVKDKIRWWAAGTNTASTDTKTITARWGATAGTGTSGNNVGVTTQATASGLIWVMTGYITKINSTTQRVSATGSTQLTGNSAAALSGISTLADTNANLFVITGKSSNATPSNDTVVCGELHLTYETGAP